MSAVNQLSTQLKKIRSSIGSFKFDVIKKENEAKHARGAFIINVILRKIDNGEFSSLLFRPPYIVSELSAQNKFKQGNTIV